MAIVPMTAAQAPAVAKLHREGIQTGLTAWLGQRFCERLYCAIAKSPYGFVLVYEDEQCHPLGFICCATDTSKMYRSVIIQHFFPLLFSAIVKFFRPSVIRRALKAIRRPRRFRTGNFFEWELPEAEVVSIGVSPDAQGKNIGTELINAALNKFRSLGFDKVRVWTSEDNKQATAFYQKRGFKFLGMRTHHSGKIRVFLADLSKQDESIP